MMGNEMDAAVGAYGDGVDLVFLAFAVVLVLWMAAGALIMRGEESEDGR